MTIRCDGTIALQPGILDGHTQFFFPHWDEENSLFAGYLPPRSPADAWNTLCRIESPPAFATGSGDLDRSLGFECHAWFGRLHPSMYLQTPPLSFKIMPGYSRWGEATTTEMKSKLAMLNIYIICRYSAGRMVDMTMGKGE